MLRDGLGIKQNYANAATFFKNVSERGITDAHYNLGLLYLDGHGVEQNQEQAEQLIKKAANNGHEKARQLVEEWRTEQ